MNKKRLFIALWIVVCLVIWFFAWQEYTKYQMRKAITEAFSGFGNVSDDSSSNSTIKDKEKKEKEPEVDTSITISKWTTETVASTYNSNNIEAEITLSEVSFTDEILPPEPLQSYYTYYPVQEGKTYAVVYLKLKNTWASNFDVGDILRNSFNYNSKCSAKAVFWGKYEYTADVVAWLEKNSKWENSYDSYPYIDPLETKDIIVAYSVPNEVKDKDAQLNICLWDQKINLDFNVAEPVEENMADEQIDE